MFNLLKPKTVYYDSLQEWRTDFWEYKRFDKVIITEVYRSSDREYVWQEGIILFYNKERAEEGKLWYSILMKDNKYFYPSLNKIKFKKSYWEFQEEFEAMEEVEKKAKELQELEEKMKTVAWELEEYYKKASKIKEKNIVSVFSQNN